MAGEFEVTKLYAKIVPKLATNFKSDLQKQINTATKGSAGTATARIGVEVSQGSLTAATKKIESTLSKAKAKVKLDIDNASIARANKALIGLKNKTVKIKVELSGYEVAKKKLDLLTKDRKLEIKTDIDKGMLNTLTKLNSIGGKGQNAIGGLAGSIDNLGRSFGRMSDFAGIAGVLVSGVAKVVGGLTGVASSATEGVGGLAASFVKMGSAAVAGAAVTVIVGGVLSLVAALGAGIIAAGGFAVAAIVLGAVVTALAIGLGALAAAAAAAIGILSGLAGALGVVAAALIPVAAAFGEFMNVQGEAPKATNNATKAVKSQAVAVKSSAAAIRNATRAYKDSQHAVSEAAYGIVRANRAVRDAGYNLQNSYRGQIKARERLNEAEEKAKKNLKDLARAARDASGKEEDAEINLIRARERLSELDPFSDDQTDYREALRDVEQAERDLADTREDNKDTLKEYDDAKKKGIAGDQDVIDATQGVKDADHEALLAREAVLDAERAAKEAKYDHTRAIQNQKDALLALQEAQQKQKQTLIDGTTATDNSTAAQRKYGKQFGELTGAGQDFVNKLKEIWTWMQKLSGIAQEAFLPGLGKALDTLKVLRPLVEEYTQKMGTALGELAVQFANVFTSKSGQLALRQLAEAGTTAVKDIGGSLARSIGELLPSLGRLAKAADPLVKAFGTGLETITAGLANMFDSFAQPQVIEGMSALITAISNVIGQTLARFGQFMENIGATLALASPALNDGLDALVDGLFSALEALINSGLLEDFGVFMSQIGGALKEMSENGFFTVLGETMGQALKVIGQGIKDLMSDPTVIDSFLELFRIMPSLIGVLIQTLPTLLPAFTNFLIAGSRFTEMFGPEIINAIAGGINLAAKAVTFMGNAFSDMSGPMKVAGGLLTAFIALVLTYNTGVLLAAAATKAWRVVQIAFNIVMAISKVRLSATGIAIVAYAAAQKVAAVATKAWAAVQVAFNAVMALNPIGLVVIAIAALVAGVIYAYTHFESFRKIVDGVWAFLKNVFSGMVNIGGDIIRGLVDGAVAAWAGFTKWVSDAFNGFINFVKGILGIASPSKVFASIGEFIIQGLLNGIKAVWGLIKSFFKLAFDGLKIVITTYFNIYKTVITTVFNAIKTVIVTVWNAIKTFLSAAFNVVKTLFTTYFTAYKTVVTTVFNIIKSTIVTVWNSIKTVFNSIVTFLKNVLSVAFNSFKTVAVGAFNNLRTGISAAWDLIKSKVFNPIKDFVTKTLPNAFNTGVLAIKKFWDKLKAYTKAPAAFVVNTVYNDGIRKLWNNTANKIPGIGDLPYVGGFAKGGKLPGNSGMRGVDDRVATVGGKMIGLAGGEYIVNAQSTKQFLPLLETLNGNKRRKNAPSSDGRDLPGFADGGFLGNLFGKFKSASRGALSAAANPILNGIRSLMPTPRNNDIASVIKGLPRGLIDPIKKFIAGDDKKNAYVPGSGTLSGGIGYQAQIKNLANAGFNLRFADSQLTGGGHSSTSNHYKGRAIDIGVGTNGRDQVERVWKYLVNNYAKSSRELYWKAKSVNYRRGEEIGPTDGYDHIHWAMNKGGLVSGLGGSIGDKVKRYLSPGEFVMNAGATKALGTSQLADANRMANNGGSPSKIRGSVKLAGAQLEGSGGGSKTYVDNRKSVVVKANIQNRQQVDQLRNKINAIL